MATANRMIQKGSTGPDVKLLQGLLNQKVPLPKLPQGKKLVEDGMTADICGTRLTNNGRIRTTSLTNRVITIDLKDLRKVSEICAVGAGSEKATSLIAGCKGGFIKKIIVDEVCALTIQSRLEEAEYTPPEH